MARLLLWPWRLGSLMVIALFSVSMAIALSVPIAGIPLCVILLSWFWKYGIALLEHALAGAAEPPALAIEMLSPLSGWRSLLILMIFVVMMFVSGAVSYVAGPYLGTVLIAAFGAIAPAMLGLLAATGNLRLALDPETWVNLIRRLGSDYGLILTCIAVLALLAVVVVMQVLAGRLWTALGIAAVMYCWLAAQAILGGVLFVRRNDSGIEDLLTPVRMVDKLDPHRDHDRDRFIDRVYGESRNGAYANAWHTLMEEIKRGDDPFYELEWIYPRVARWPDPLIANRLAQEFLPQLLLARRYSDALHIVRDRMAASPDFHARTSEDMFRLATFARDVGDRPTARMLLGNFARFYPQAPERPAADALARELAR